MTRTCCILCPSRYLSKEKANLCHLDVIAAFVKFNDEDMDFEDRIQHRTQLKGCFFRIMCILLIIVLALAFIGFILTFVVFPLVFMNSVTLQQNLVFTHWNLKSKSDFYEHYPFPGLKNHYVAVNDLDNSTELKLGLWHMLPLELANIAFTHSSYDFNKALKSSNYSVLLYFHGTGEDRSQSQRKYQLLRNFFHVIAFDYRSYGDSSKGNLFEKNVVNDCIQIYKWLQTRTDSKIYLWGHSLGTALATSTVAQLRDSGKTAGLILEAPFTNFIEELYHHPYAKIFSWLPWFKLTVVKPLEENGFLFNTSKNILDVDCTIMFLHAKDDKIVPYYMSEKLYEIAERRNVTESIKNNTMMVVFDANLGLDHYFIYQDPYLVIYLYEFLKRTSSNMDSFYKGLHQS